MQLSYHADATTLLMGCDGCRNSASVSHPNESIALSFLKV